MSYLIYVNELGPNYKGDNIYEFIFSDSSENIWGENWDAKPSNRYPLPPDLEHIKKVGVLKNDMITMSVIQNSDYFSMIDSMDGIIALAYENESDDVDFDRLTILYDLLGIDRFNKLDDKIFSESYVVNDVIGRPVKDITYIRGGKQWYMFWKLEREETSKALSILTNKEKDRIVNLNLHLQEETVHMIKEHIRYKLDLKRLGEDVKMKFNNMDELISEHEEWSRLIQSYRTGEVVRYYGEVDVLETPIIYNDETYYPVLLSKTEDYEKESQHQKNCVRTYSQRPDCMIFSIRKGSPTGDERVTVEYQFRQKEVLNVQERARFNGMSPFEFSEVARVQLANINLMYKLGTLKLPKMIKKYRNGKVVEQQSVFNSDAATVNGGKMIRMTPSWDNDTPELSTYGELIPVNPVNFDFFDDLP